MYLANMNWPAVDALDRATPIVIPVAAVEQHGHHLPLFTDSLLLGEVVRRAEAALPNEVLFTPLQWLGNSDHHIDYPGTLSAPPRVYLDLLRGLAENFLSHGFHRLVFLNGHGGNTTPLKQALFELRQQHRRHDGLVLLSAAYWDFAAPAGFHQDFMGHACEWETSMILHLAPHLVTGDLGALGTVDHGYGYGPAYRAWITRERTPTGHIGSPQFATAEKGGRLFDAFTAGVVEWLRSLPGAVHPFA